MKAFLKKFWHYVVVGLCVIIAGLNYLANDVKPDVKAITAGDLSTVGQAAEDAAGN